jgi:hypothetical protein
MKRRKAKKYHLGNSSLKILLIAKNHFGGVNDHEIRILLIFFGEY